ncbi:MAG: hypothetical protein IM581_12225 [Chitinophagaceae bacterium]|nr:hypothetical protein [Chitinophagaceae bacterium]
MLDFVYINYTDEVLNAKTDHFTGVDLIKGFTTNELQHVKQNIWAIIACCNAFGGLAYYSFTGKERGLGFVLSLTAIISLFFLRTSELYPDFLKYSPYLRISMEWPYWAMIVLFGISACISFLAKREMRETRVTQNQLHINIITGVHSIKSDVNSK